MRPSPVAALRRPEHTGENRCWPCTAVNVAIVAVLAAAVALASPSLAVGTAVAGLSLVAVRGYLIPGTPRFAPAVVARLPGGEALFHDAGSRGSGSLGGDRSDDPTADDDGDANTDGDELAAPPGGDTLLDRLVDAGVLDADGERVAPTPEFEERWHAEMAALRGADTDALADAALELSPATESHAVRQDGGEWVALSAGAEHAFEETWLDRPVAIAEIGGARAAADFVDGDTALAAAQTCRMFLSSCPDCETALERGTEVDCCGGYHGANEVPAETLVCPSCEVRIYTFG